MKLIQCTYCHKAFKVDVLNENCIVEDFCCKQCETKYTEIKAEVKELDRRFGYGK